MTDATDSAAATEVARVDRAAPPVPDSALETVRERAQERDHDPAQVREGAPGLAAVTLVRDRVRIVARTRG